eukprot:tig00020796_g13720.t1
MALDPGQIYEHCQFLAEVQLTRYNFKSAGNVALVGMSFQQTILKLNSSIPSYPVLHYTLALSRLEQGDISGATYWAEAAFKLIRDTDATESKRCCVWDHLFIKVECLIRRLALLSDEVLRYCELLWWISERCCGSCLLSQYRLERAASTLGTMFMWVDRSSDASNVYQKFVMLTEEKIGKHTVHYVRALMHGAAFNEKVLKRIDRAQSLTKIAILIAADVDRNLSSVLNSAGREAAVSVPAEGYGATDEHVDGMENARGTPIGKRGKGNQARQRTISRPHSEQTVPSSKDWLTDVHVACTTSGALKSKKYNHLLQRVMLA